MIYEKIYLRASSLKNAYRLSPSVNRTVRLINQRRDLSSYNMMIMRNVLPSSSSMAAATAGLGRVDSTSSIRSRRSLSGFTQPMRKDPESKAEQTVNLLKENILDLKKDESAAAAAAAAAAAKEKQTATTESTTTITTSQTKPEPVSVKIEKKEDAEKIKTPPLTVEASKAAQTVADTISKQVDVKRPTLWQRIVKELKHYSDGFKLLYFETKITYGLLKKVLRGETLTRRERRHFTRTAADLFRLVPFSVFVIVPFMEFTLPIFLKLFPNMLPSTFQEQSKEQEKLKKRLKAKLEMAKFLQDTLEETALKVTDPNQVNAETHALNQKFAEFMKKIRSKGEQPSNEEIMKYSSLFENELTLDNLTRQQLIALCQILDINTLGNIPPNHILRFQLRMKIRNLEADDKVIIKEGVDTLTTEELQMACRERGMRSIGLTENRLRHQLEQWLDLHINRKIPLSLLLLSRALYLPENLPPEDIIKTTISALPQSVDDATRVKVAEISGAGVDSKTKLELLKQEDAQIKLENAATAAAAAEAQPAETASHPPQAQPSPVPAMKPEPVVAAAEPEKDFAAEQLKKEKLIDKAHVIITANEAKEIGDIIENLPTSASKQAKAEIKELKKDVDEYKEDVKEIEEIITQAGKGAAKLTETKSAKLLSKRVQKLLQEVDSLVATIEKEEKATAPIEASKNAVSIDELVETIKRFKGISSSDKEKKLMHVLQTLDKDKDGKIDDLNDVLKVFELIEQENVQVTKDQLGKILNLLEKEKLIEMEEQKVEAANKQEKKQKSN